MQLILQTGSASLAINVNIAIPDLKEPVNQFRRAIGSARREKRAEIKGLVLKDFSSHVDLGEGLSGELYVGIGLVIAQQDVEGRPMLFY